MSQPIHSSQTPHIYKKKLNGIV